MRQGPLRRIVIRGAGSDQLECSHITGHRPERQAMARCFACLPLEIRNPAAAAIARKTDA